jgi:hypothetical protein
MRKVRKCVLVTMAVVFGFILGACGSSALAEQKNPLQIWGQNENGCYSTLYVKDEDTGVNYVVVSAEGMYHGELSVAITPRLNSDSSLYTTK